MLWEMSPRQLAACLQLAQARHGNNAAQTLALTALGAQGKGEDINRHIDELQR